MRTLKAIQASRANGARSCGPNTPEGKRRASINAMRHGLLAKGVVLDNESGEIFSELLAQHLDKFAPADGVEECAVEEMAASAWRLRRLWAIETRILANAVEKRPEANEIDRIAAAFTQL